MEDTGFHLLIDPCLVFGHQGLWRFESRGLQKLRRVYEAYPVHYLAYGGQFLRYFFDKYRGNIARRSGTSCAFVMADLDSLDFLSQVTLTLYLET